MDNKKISKFVEESFLSSILKDPQVTDISFNGEDFFYLHNLKGRKKSDIKVSDQEIKDFLRQIANICEKQFSHQNPNLDVSFGKYRLNAVHQSIGRKKGSEALSFSLRIASLTPRIVDDGSYMSNALTELFQLLLDSHVSIVLGGLTGTGKTEFQKYLIRKMSDNTRIIIIDNVLELSQINDSRLDITCWQSEDNNISDSIQKLVRNALRSNPDWLIVAESRGAEMIETLNSAMTGHPIITTIHAQSAETMPFRMARMIMMNDKKMDIQNVLEDIYYHFHVYVYLAKDMNDDGSVIRFIKEVIYLDEYGKKYVIYQKDRNEEKYGKFPANSHYLFKNIDHSSDCYHAFFGGKS